MAENAVIDLISRKLSIPGSSVGKTVALLDSGATIPFIARYRKERTGNLDELMIASISDAMNAFRELEARKSYILKTLDDQGLLSADLASKIKGCWSAEKLEDYYLPFKKKRKTRAEQARKNGLSPLADILWQQQENQLLKTAELYTGPEIENGEMALSGARDIIAERINEDSHNRDIIRGIFDRHALLSSKVIGTKKEAATKYKDYFDYSEKLDRAPSHRILAIFRAEKEGLLRCKIGIDEEKAAFRLSRLLIRNNASRACRQQIIMAIEDALKRLMLPSIENEFRKKIKEKADEEAIAVFTNNLEQLLLAPPLGSKRTMGIDPGFRTGCKVACLDENGNLLEHIAIYPHPPQNQWAEAREKINHLIDTHRIEAIAIGNGTAGRETFEFLKAGESDQKSELFLINEDGASVYSASETARTEFPNLDITVRGAVSIGRRLMDPLSELVKIEPRSIGVGQYQHDVNQSMLKTSLDRCVEHCVNAIGADLNTASPYLLQHISGLGPVLASNIEEYRKVHGSFKSIEELKKVPRLGDKAFELSAGFLRIRNGDNLLDNTGVHPERYRLVNRIARDLGTTADQLVSNNTLIERIDIGQYLDEDTGRHTLNDIIAELRKPGFDIRGAAEAVRFSEGIRSIEDVRPGMQVNGIISNITKFGAFVDIGIKEAGLIHVSQMANHFIKGPMEVVKLNQNITAKVLDVDLSRKRISLSLKT